MKPAPVIGLVVVSVLITLAIEESRIATLRSGLPTAQTTAGARPTVAAAPAVADEAPVQRTKNRPELKPAAPVKPGDTESESFARTARKMWDNPAGKSMMNQGAKMMVGMMYQDFIDSLNLSKEEGEYFKNLLGKEITDQQELGMKMLGAAPEERAQLTAQLAQRAKDNEAEIKKFLNNDEDLKSYADYKRHLPEHQQLDAIRTAMNTAGAPLDTATETRLADAMYHARTAAKTPDLSGPAALDGLAKGNLVETYEKSWQVQQDTLQPEVAKILNPTQLAAFQEYQKQAKDMQLMGLKMAEQLMPGKKDGAP